MSDKRKAIKKEKQKEKLRSSIDQEREAVLRAAAESFWQELRLSPPNIECPYIKCKMSHSFKSPEGLVVNFKLETAFGDINKISIPIQPTQNPDSIKARIKEITNRKSFNLNLNLEYTKILTEKVMHLLREKPYPDIPEWIIPMTPYEDFLFIAKRKDYVNYGMIQDTELSINGIISFEMKNVRFEYNIENKTVSCAEFDELIRMAEFTKQYNNEIHECLNIAMQHRIGDIGFRINAYAVIVTMNHKRRRAIKFNDFSVQEFKNCIDEMELGITKKSVEKTDRLYQIPVYGNLLAINILKFIKINQNAYPSADAVMKNFMGLQQTFDNKLTNTAASGKFEVLGPDEILDMIQELINFGLVKPLTYKTARIKYHCLTLSERGEGFLVLPHRSPIEKEYKEYNDVDWEWFLKSSGFNYYDDNQIEILDKKNVVCLHQEKIKEFLKNKPEHWKEYAEFMYELENDIGKRYWKFVIGLFDEQDSVWAI